MAPKRFKKSDINEENGKKYKNLIISDVLCPICRSIFIEPVTLPCSHGFCLTCFNSTMENTTLTCPLCRIRIGSWLRSARKEKKIINDVLWQMIQVKFSKQIRKKLEGDDITSEEKIPIKLADPGEIRKEYETQLQRERSELQKRNETESKASEIVIKKILEEEQNAAKIEEEKLRLDEEMARRIAAESTIISSSSSQIPSTPKSSKKSSIDRYLIALSKKKQEPDTNKPKTDCVKPELCIPNKSTTKEYNSTIICQSRIKQQCSKAYQHLLLTKTLQYERAESNESDSGDSIKQEMRYFKPIRVARVAPTEKFHGDKNFKSQLIKIPTVHATSKSLAVIRSPQNSIVRIQAHPGSAFVSCCPEPNLSSCISPVTQPSIISESGKIIKQYYNKKRNTLCNKLQSCSVSPDKFPCLGFAIENEYKYVTIMRDLVSTMSEHVNRCLARSTDNKNILKEVPRKNLTLSCDISKSKKHLKASSKKLNGFDTPVESVPIDINLQEQLDLEFAKRLHEELNNPRNRQTRASNQPKKSAIKTRSSPRKRQVTLDELIPSKKFKI